jgi:hypothetical protein
MSGLTVDRPGCLGDFGALLQRRYALGAVEPDVFPSNILDEVVVYDPPACQSGGPIYIMGCITARGWTLRSDRGFSSDSAGLVRHTSCRDIPLTLRDLW